MKVACTSGLIYEDNYESFCTNNSLSSWTNAYKIQIINENLSDYQRKFIWLSMKIYLIINENLSDYQWKFIWLSMKNLIINENLSSQFHKLHFLSFP